MTLSQLARSTCLVSGLLGLGNLAASSATPADPSPDSQAAAIVARMTTDQLLTLVDGQYAVDANFIKPPNVKPPAALGSAGYVPGVAALHLPPLQETDAGVGVADPLDESGHPVRGTAGYATAAPSGLATAATWDPALAFAAGRMIGGEARAQGFNVMLAGGTDLTRDPRNGRNFEYAGEDPVLAGTISGAEIRGIQSQHVISTIKHFALNDYETNRFTASADIDWAAARESDLLAFEIAIGIGHPGSVMCSYNQINGQPACGDATLLNTILKGDWHYPGWVMSDWGAIHSLSVVNTGVDQESGDYFDIPNGGPFYTEKLRQTLADGRVSRARLDDMARRIIRSERAVGIGTTTPKPYAIEAAADRAIALRDEEEAAVLLRNEGAILPLKPGTRIAVIGGNAANGVLEGGGSSEVWPIGGPAEPIDRDLAFPHPVIWDPSAPLTGLRVADQGGRVSWTDGRSIDQAVAAAKSADVAIVFADQWLAESFDAKSLSLPPDAATGADQDKLIAAVAAANPHTVVVLETGGPVAMPWLSAVQGVLEAWYAGAAGGEAIARLLYGAVDPSGHLPITFPASEAQLPRPAIPQGQHVDYDIEGAAVGYKWFAERHETPLFPFGDGLSYTRFAIGHLAVTAGAQPRITLDVTNAGGVAGQAVPQVYVLLPDGISAAPFRLVGFAKLALAPGQTGPVSLTVDPRLLAEFDAKRDDWRVAAGVYTVRAGFSSADLPISTRLRVTEARLAP
jgi:beta-glucosidase